MYARFTGSLHPKINALQAYCY